MKFIDDIRRENLGILKEEFGSLSALAKCLERSESQISQWINGSLNSGNNKPRGMRSSTARWIDIKCSKENGWLDVPHDAESNRRPSLQMALRTGESAPPEYCDKWQADTQEERDLLAGFRAAGPERREDMLDAARKSLKTNQAAA